MIVDLIKMIKVAYTPLRTQAMNRGQVDSSAIKTTASAKRSYGGSSVQILSSGSWLSSKGRVTTPRMARELKRKVLSHDFTPEKVR